MSMYKRSVLYIYINEYVQKIRMYVHTSFCTVCIRCIYVCTNAHAYVDAYTYNMNIHIHTHTYSNLTADTVDQILRHPPSKHIKQTQIYTYTQVHTSKQK